MSWRSARPTRSSADRPARFPDAADRPRQGVVLRGTTAGGGARASRPAPSLHRRHRPPGERGTRSWSPAGPPAAFTGARSGASASCTIAHGGRRAAPSPPARVAGVPTAAPGAPAPACRISDCDLWLCEGLPFCLSHGNRWKEKGRPDIDELPCGYEDDSVPGHERIDLTGLGAHLRLEVQYALQGRNDARVIKIAPGAVQHRGHVPGSPRCPGLAAGPGRGRPGGRRGSSGSPGGSPPARGLRPGAAGLCPAQGRAAPRLAVAGPPSNSNPRDAWRLRNLGVSDGPATGRLRLDLPALAPATWPSGGSGGGWPAGSGPGQPPRKPSGSPGSRRPASPAGTMIASPRSTGNC